jgi:2-polyprenyl-6-methoxyphenol hydroxylase-like FAD-dependent oxidoreductase
MRLYDKHGAVLFENLDNEGNRPEVDRGQLRQILLDSLPDGVIRWDHELNTVVALPDNRFQLCFKNGVRENVDLVIGADGAWSRIRPLLSDVRPTYSGVSFFELHFQDVDRRHPEIAKLIGHGLTFALGDSKALIGHRDAGSHVGIYAGLRVPEDWVAQGGVDLSSSKSAKQSLADQFDGWSDSLLQTILRSDDHIAPRPIHALPVGHRWTHRPGLTLIGDAAHLMSPFSGEGANLAMLDATDLAHALASSLNWDAAIQQFEEKMFARAAIAAAGAKQGIDETFSDNGLEHALQHSLQHHTSAS